MIQAFDNKKISFGISTVDDGNLSFVHDDNEVVIGRRKKFLDRLGLKLDDCAVMSVKHSDDIKIVDSEDKGKGTKVLDDAVLVDALMTQEKNLGLFLLTADCLPIAFYDREKEVIALAHLGWKPTDKELAKKVVNKMSESFQSSPADILVYIGPGIHKQSYVHKNPIQKEIPKWQPFLEDLPNGDTMVDILGFNKSQLIDAGVFEENITVDNTDTFVSDKYFSHYRSQKTGEPEGRIATVIALK